MIHSKRTILLVFLCFFLTLASVSAQSFDVLESTVSVSLAPNTLKSVPLNIQNTGTTVIDLSFDTSQLDLTDSNGETISLTFSPSSPQLQPNETKQVLMDFLPDPQISFERFGGTLTVLDSTTGDTDTVQLNIDIEPDVCDFGEVGSDLQINIKEPDSSDDFKPGDVMKIEVDVDNEGQNDIRVQVEAFLFNDNQNIADTSSNTQRIDENKDETFDLTLTVPLETEDFDEDDELTLFIKAFDDEDEQLNCVQERQDVDIKLDDDDIVIDTAESRLFPAVAACGDSISASIRVINIGDDDNDRVSISLINSELNINEKSDTFNLERFSADEENTAVRQFQVRIPSDAREKSYDIQARVSFDGGSDTTFFPLDVSSCQSAGFAGTLSSVSLKPLETALFAKQGSVISIPVEIVNNQFQRKVFAVTVANVEDFADISTKTVTLGPNAKTTTFLDLVVRESALSGVYGATILVKEGTQVAASTTVQVKVDAGEASAQSGAVSPLVGGIPTSVWVIGNIIVLALVILSLSFMVLSLKRGSKHV